MCRNYSDPVYSGEHEPRDVIWMGRPDGQAEAVTNGYAGIGVMLFGIFYFFYRKMWMESAVWAIIVLILSRGTTFGIGGLFLAVFHFLLMPLIIGRLVIWRYRRKGWTYITRLPEDSPPSQSLMDIAALTCPGILMRRPDGREEYVTNGNAGIAFILFGIFYFFYHRMWIESAAWAIIVLTLSVILVLAGMPSTPEQVVKLLISARFLVSFVIIGRLVRWHYHRKGWEHIKRGRTFMDELRSIPSGLVGWWRKE